MAPPIDLVSPGDAAMRTGGELGLFAVESLLAGRATRDDRISFSLFPRLAFTFLPFLKALKTFRGPLRSFLVLLLQPLQRFLALLLGPFAHLLKLRARPAADRLRRRHAGRR